MLENMPLRLSYPESPDSRVGDLAGRQSHDIKRPLSRSPAALDRIRTRNRRKRYLDLHPEYFASPSLELAGLPYTQQQLR